MAWHVDLDDGSYEAAREGFEWDLPDDYNIVRDLLRKHEDTDATALYRHHADGTTGTYSFAELDRLSDRVANALAKRGITVGRRLSDKEFRR